MQTKTVLTEAIVTRALQTMFGEDVMRPEDMPRLNKIDRSVRGHPKKAGEKPVETRIEYKLLKNTPRDADGNLTLEGMIAYYPNLSNTEFRNRTFAELSGARLIAILAHCAEVDEPTRKEVNRFVSGVEFNINAGENECGGKHSVLGNSGQPPIEAVNCWVKGWKRESHIIPAPTDDYATKITAKPTHMTRS